MRFSLPCRILFSALLVFHGLAPSAKASESSEEKSSFHFYVTGTGLLLMAGGGAYAYYQNREADQAMAFYRRSAFTENTQPLRQKVEEHERLTVLGLAGLALGGILVVVSF